MPARHISRTAHEGLLSNSVLIWTGGARNATVSAIALACSVGTCDRCHERQTEDDRQCDGNESLTVSADFMYHSFLLFLTVWCFTPAVSTWYERSNIAFWPIKGIIFRELIIKLLNVV